MVVRNIIKIDESLCNGCGNCITACSEGAIKLVAGKAQVVSDAFCDGLGACLGECPVGAITIEQRDAPAFDEEATKAHFDQSKCHQGQKSEMKKSESIASCNVAFHTLSDAGPKRHMRKLGPSSQLSSWPIQMLLAHADAPYFKGARLLIAADCSAFACPSISELIKGRVVLIGCPKLDETSSFTAKLTEILRGNDITGITILHMEVPCCANLVRLVSQSIKRSGKEIPFQQLVCSIDGSVAEEQRRS
jgi:ferredoxin